MMGKLKKMSVREVYGKNVMRLSIDIPLEEVRGTNVDGEDLPEWARSRVGKNLGVDITTLDEQGQDTVVEE